MVGGHAAAVERHLADHAAAPAHERVAAREAQARGAGRHGHGAQAPPAGRVGIADPVDDVDVGDRRVGDVALGAGDHPFVARRVVLDAGAQRRCVRPGAGLGDADGADLTAVQQAGQVAGAHRGPGVAVQSEGAAQRGGDRRLEGVVDERRLLGEHRGVREPGLGERAVVEVSEQEPQVAGLAQRADDLRDRVPVVVLLDRRGARRQLAGQERADVGPERAVGVGEQEVARGRRRCRGVLLIQQVVMQH
jgi:hypothetical protein